MKIFISPSDLVERCLWSNYVKFVLKTRDEEKLKQIIAEDKVEVLSENDAYVIGLLKYIKTENLVHRCKLEIEDILKIKSTIITVDNIDRVLINKASLIKDVLDFKYRFPDYYQADEVYKKSIVELNTFTNNLLDIINNFTEYPLTIKDKNYTFVLSGDVSKNIKV